MAGCDVAAMRQRCCCDPLAARLAGWLAGWLAGRVAGWLGGWVGWQDDPCARMTRTNEKCNGHT
eukprot:5519477-Prorocentrum_lima.AAC.1